MLREVLDMLHKKISWPLQGIGGGLLGLWLAAPAVVQALIVVTGLHLFAYLVERATVDRLDSHAVGRFVASRVMQFVLVAVVYVLSARAVNVGIVVGGELAGAVAGFYVVQEVVGIMERAVSLGVPLPDFLRRFFQAPEKGGASEG